jgi:hypothetical protein
MVNQKGYEETDQEFEECSGGHKDCGDPERVTGDRVPEKFYKIVQTYKGVFELGKGNDVPVEA